MAAVTIRGHRRVVLSPNPRKLHQSSDRNGDNGVPLVRLGLRVLAPKWIEEVEHVYSVVPGGMALVTLMPRSFFFTTAFELR